MKNVMLVWAVFGTLAPVAAAQAPLKFKVGDKQREALGIQVAPLKRGGGESIAATFPAHVIVSPDREQVVSSPIAGLVIQILVQLNQSVKQGAGLLRISGPELGQQQLQLMQAASRVALGRQAAARDAALLEEGIVAQRRVQESRAALKEAEAGLAQAKASLLLSGMPAATIERVAAGGKLEDSLLLVAPRSGLVTRLDARPGQRVEPVTPLLQIAETDRLSLDIQVPATEGARWKPGAKVKVQGREASARIVSSGSMVSSGSQTVTIRAVVDSGAASLRAGESIAVEMPGASTHGWELPLAAVARDGPQAYIFVKTTDGFEARTATVAASGDRKVRVQGAFKDGEQVAVNGVAALKGAWLEEKEKAEKEKGSK